MAPEPSESHDDIERMLADLVGPEAARKMMADMRSAGIDPAALARGQVPANMGGFLSMARDLLASPDGPVNWELATQVAKTRARQGDRPVTSARADELKRALMQADLWLDAVTDHTAREATRQAWNRERWIDETLGVWKQLTEPVAINATNAMREALSAQFGNLDMGVASAQIPGIGNILGPTDPNTLISSMAAGIFGLQVGQAIGELSMDALGSTDIGLPLGAGNRVALVADAVESFGEGLGIEATSVAAFLAVREVAHARLFSSAPWLRAHVVSAIRAYASEIRFDLAGIEEAMREAASGTGLEGDPQALAVDISEKMFAADPTPSQREALGSLETTLAVIEGWVSFVTERACQPFIPAVGALDEMMRRRRASGSPAEQVLHRLIGVSLRPKRARDAKTLWAYLDGQLGDERDGVWDHPSRLPLAADLDDPTNYLSRREQEEAAEASIDAELATLLDGSLGYASGLKPGTESEGDQSVREGE